RGHGQDLRRFAADLAAVGERGRQGHRWVDRRQHRRDHHQRRQHHAERGGHHDGVMVTTAFCVVLSPLMVITPVLPSIDPPVTLPTTFTDSCEICGEASEILPVPAAWTASEIAVLKPDAARISSDTRARTV